MEDDLATTFLEIKTTHGHSISITKDHMLMVASGPTPPHEPAMQVGPRLV